MKIIKRCIKWIIDDTDIEITFIKNMQRSIRFYLQKGVISYGIQPKNTDWFCVEHNKLKRYYTTYTKQSCKRCLQVYWPEHFINAIEPAINFWELEPRRACVNCLKIDYKRIQERKTGPSRNCKNKKSKMLKLWSSEISNKLVKLAKTTNIYQQHLWYKTEEEFTFIDYVDILIFNFYLTRQFLINELWTKHQDISSYQLQGILFKLLAK